MLYASIFLICLMKRFEPKNAFERLCKRPLSERELFEMKENLKGFLDVLIRVDKRERITNGAKYEKGNRSPNSAN